MHTLAQKRNMMRSYRTAKARAIVITDTPAAYWFLVAIIVVSFALYVTFINQTVHNVIKRQALEKHISSLTSEIGDLETQDFALSSEITLDKAHALGFKDVDSATFLARSSAPEVAMNRP